MFIEQIKTQLDIQFPNNWRENDTNTFSPINLFDFINEFHENINLSILTGEYIFESHSLSTVGNALLDIIFEGEKSDDNRIGTRNVIDLLYYLFSLISRYEEFSGSLKNSLEESSRTISVPSVLTKLREGIESKINRLPYFGVETQYKLFQINLTIAQIDHSISASVDQIGELVNQTILLDKYKHDNYPYFPYILEKAYVLLQKIFRVLDSSDQNVKIFDGYVTTNEDVVSHKVKYYSNFLERSKLFSPNDDINDSARSRIRKSEQKLNSLRELEFLDFKLILRFISLEKKSNPSHTKILEKFESSQKRFIEGSGFVFNKVSYDTCLLYIKNNHLSFLIKKNKPYIEIQKMYSDIISLQENTSSVNYFPHLKYSKYLMSLIESLMNNSDLESSSKIEELFGELREVSKKLEFMFFLSQDKKIIPFQAPLKECLQTVTFRNKKIDLFLSSSYCLPLDFLSIKKDVDLTINRIELIRLKLDLLINFHEIEEKLGEANNQLKNSNKSQIEILSIFAAIVLFVASNIQLFPRFTSLNQALLFTLTQAYCLGLFVMLIWFVTRGNLISSSRKRNIPLTHISMFTLFVIITAILVVLILYFVPDMPLMNAVPIKLQP